VTAAPLGRLVYLKAPLPRRRLENVPLNVVVLARSTVVVAVKLTTFGPPAAPATPAAAARVSVAGESGDGHLHGQTMPR